MTMLDSAYKNQIETAFDEWLDSPETRFRHKALLERLFQIRDDYRHEVGADEKTLGEFEREVSEVAWHYDIDYDSFTNFWEQNAPRGESASDYIETDGQIIFSDDCEICFVYTRKKGSFEDSDKYVIKHRIPELCDYQIAELTSGMAKMPMAYSFSPKVWPTPERVVESLILNRADSPILGKRENHLSCDDFLGYGSALLGLSYVEGGVSPDFVKYCLDEQMKETYGRDFVSILDLGVPRELVMLARKDYEEINEAVRKENVTSKAKEALANIGLEVDSKRLGEILPC